MMSIQSVRRFVVHDSENINSYRRNQTSKIFDKCVTFASRCRWLRYLFTLGVSSLRLFEWYLLDSNNFISECGPMQRRESCFSKGQSPTCSRDEIQRYLFGKIMWHISTLHNIHHSCFYNHVGPMSKLKSSHSSMGTGWASTWQMEVELGTGGERSGGGSGCGKGNGWDGRRKGARRVTLDGWTTIWTSWSDHEPKVESCGTKSNPIDLFCEQSSETDQSTLVSGSLIPFVWSLRRYRR